MKTYPLLLSPPMVKAVLSGRKTQTRRKITSMWSNVKMRHDLGEPVFLWVKESWFDNGGVIRHRSFDSNDNSISWKSSLFMPRKYSRLTLEVADVRIQRLQDISCGDCVAEGINFPAGCDDGPLPKWARREYGTLWIALNGEASWNSNPEIIALTFHALRRNIAFVLGEKNAE